MPSRVRRAMAGGEDRGARRRAFLFVAPALDCAAPKGRRTVMKKKSARPAMSPALSIGCVYYYVTDMERSVRFYTRVLGLPLVVRYGDYWAEVDAGSTRIGLHPSDGKDTKPGPGGGTVSFYVEDLKRLMAKLAKKGAKVVTVA